MSDNSQVFPNQNLRPEVAIQTNDGYFQILNSCCPPVKVEEDGRQQQEQGIMSEKEKNEANHYQNTGDALQVNENSFQVSNSCASVKVEEKQGIVYEEEEHAGNHNQGAGGALQVNDDSFQIPNSCPPLVKVEEEQQEILFEKSEHEEDRDQKTFALIEKIMLTEYGFDQQTINETIERLNKNSKEFSKENLRARIGKENEELNHDKGFYKRREDEEIEMQEKALLKLQEERKNQELIDYFMAEKIQNEENGTYPARLEYQDAGYLKRFRTKRKKRIEEQCMICLEIIEDEKCFEIEACEHNFHRECLENYIITETRDRKIPIKCPLHDKCGAVLNEHDVKICVQTPENLEYHIKYDKTDIQVYIDRNPTEFYHCPTPGCEFVCCFRGAKFECPWCKKISCKECKLDYWHEKMNCVEFQEQKGKQKDESYEDNAKSQGYKRCPQCEILIERTAGCNAMVCSRCQTPFCYTCGKRGDGHNCTH